MMTLTSTADRRMEERAERVRRLVRRTFRSSVRALPRLENQFEAMVADDKPLRAADEARQALRLGPWDLVRKDGKEVLSLLQAQDEAALLDSGDAKPQLLLPLATSALDDILAGLQALDYELLRIEQRQGGASPELATAALGRLNKPFAAFADLGDAFADRVLGLKTTAAGGASAVDGASTEERQPKKTTAQAWAEAEASGSAFSF
mmetsp:Transcript_28577/g.63800  ORF Transcript_28577/g.63800 Transcript_28577/m.63800 type:complete len:206 (-) Transcript_28577:168-785(-)